MPLAKLYEGYEKTKFCTLIIYTLKSEIYFRTDDERSLIRNVLESYLSVERDGENYTGKEALARLCDDLYRIKNWDREAFKAKLMDFNTVYKTWGLIGVKRIISELCSEKPYLAEFYPEKDEIAEKRNGLSRYIVKIAIAYRPAMIDSFKDKVLALIEQEDTLYQKILSVL